MATLVRRRGSKVYLYYYDSRLGRIVQVPRSITQGWDDLPPGEVLELKRQWEEDNGRAKSKIARMVLREGDKALRLWNEYQLQRKRNKKRTDHTETQEKRHFEAFMCPYFVGLHQAKDPTTWHGLVPGFHDWLHEKDLTDSHRRKILWALERFGKHLVFKRYMTFPFTVQTPSRDDINETPLKIEISPDRILSVVKVQSFTRPPNKHGNRTSNVNFKLAVLLGYFCSLRPEELYALEKSDILTGQEAVEKSNTYDGLKTHNLGSKITVSIQKALQGNEIVERLKTHHSHGYVNVWHPQAALAIAAIVRGLPDGRLFPFTRGYLDRAWKEIVYPILGVTAHDLRRASAVYLGRVAMIPMSLLQEHMRHADLSTTAIYMRRPKKEVQKNRVVKQDFDDVV